MQSVPITANVVNLENAMLIARKRDLTSAPKEKCVVVSVRCKVKFEPSLLYIHPQTLPLPTAGLSSLIMHEFVYCFL
jgi:hypothetical protein